MKRYTIFAFFGLTFLITWGIAGLYLLFPEQTEAVFGQLSIRNPLYLLAVYAPGLSAFIVVGVTHGWQGLRTYLRRLLHWRIPALAYLAVLLGLPALMMLSQGITVALGKSTPPYPFSPWYAVIPVALLDLVRDPGGMEELGWRGFALPELQSRMSALWASVILGTIWGLWHLPAFFLSDLEQGTLVYPLFLLSDIFLSILMTALYNATGGSIPLMYLFHWMMNDPFQLKDTAVNLPVLTAMLAIITVGVVLITGPQRLGTTKYVDTLTVGKSS